MMMAAQGTAPSRRIMHPTCRRNPRGEVSARCDRGRDSSGLARVRVVLCNPQGAMNVGAVARAMANFQLDDLVLVDPTTSVRDAGVWAPDCVQFATAVGHDVLSRARVVSSLDAVLADSQLIYGTCAVSRKAIPAVYPKDAAATIVDAVSSDPEARVSLLFGNERTGLRSDQLRHVNATIHIPTSGPRTDSLNLSHAAACIFYELFSTLRARDGVGRAPQSSRKAKTLSFEAKAVLKDALLRARRLLDACDPSQMPLTVASDEDSIDSFLARNDITRKDAAFFFSLANRIHALAETEGSDGEGKGHGVKGREGSGVPASLLRPAIDGVVRGSRDHAAVRMRGEEELQELLKRELALSLTKEELGALARDVSDAAGVPPP